MFAKQPAFTAIALTTISCLVFFYFVGFYQQRLAFNVVLPLIVGAAIVALDIGDKAPQSPHVKVAFVVWAIAIARIVFECAKSGPYI